MEISPLMFMIKQNGDNKSSCNILLSFLFLTSSHSNLNTHKNEKQLINSLDEALQCGYQNSAFLMFYLIPLWALDIIFPHKTDKSSSAAKTHKQNGDHLSFYQYYVNALFLLVHLSTIITYFLV